MLGSASDDMAPVHIDPFTARGEPDLSRIPFALYVAVEDVDGHCERGGAAGTATSGSQTTPTTALASARARDLEGNVWSFGTYRPAATDS